MAIEKKRLAQLLLIGFSGLLISNVQAEIRPERIHIADSKKNKSYIHDGMIIGGDRAINDVVVKDIRRAANPGFERVVIDLSGTQNGESKNIQHPPYYQLAVSPDERRLTISVFGKPKLEFNAKKVISNFKRSQVVQKVELLPRLEEDNWTSVFELKADSSVEVFELSNPVRVIIDIKPQKS